MFSKTLVIKSIEYNALTEQMLNMLSMFRETKYTEHINQRKISFVYRF